MTGNGYDAAADAARLLEDLTAGEAEGACLASIGEDALQRAHRAGVDALRADRDAWQKVARAMERARDAAWAELAAIRAEVGEAWYQGNASTVEAIRRKVRKLEGLAR